LVLSTDKKRKGDLMKVTVDKIENEKARLLIRPQEKEDFVLPLKELPAKTEEGSILEINFKLAENEKKAAEKRVSSLLNKLKNKKS
jgi:hypothetical protein